MEETLEGRFWSDTRAPILYIISTKVPRTSFDGFTVRLLDANQEIDDIIFKLINTAVDAVYTNIYDIDFIKQLIEMGIVVYFPQRPKFVKCWEIQKFGMLIYTVGGVKKDAHEEKFKRLMDIGIATVGCAMTCVMYPIIAYQIKKEDGGDAIFKQERLGYNGQPFEVYKFRSMRMTAEEEKQDLMEENEMDNQMFKMKEDPRITKVGAFLRKTSLDEFPQFFNVLKGDMSIVGTRPPTKDELQTYTAHHKSRLNAKPGITGVWQTHGRNEISNFEQVVNMDNRYIRHGDIKDYVYLVAKTFQSMLNRTGE